MIWSKLLHLYVLFDIVGLGITLAGALISARGAVMEDHDARKIARTDSDHNDDLEHALRDQSKSAKYGFLLIAIGTITQMIATLAQAFEN